MICIECSHPVSSLYIKYSDSNIRLSRCANCGQPCDVYVEYDKVLLAIDLLLLKPQAFKHLIYNKLIDTENVQGLRKNTIFQQYRQLIRVSLVIMLFKVYLNWAYEEKNPRSKYSFILNTQNMFYQYIFFITQTILQDLLYHSLIHLGLKWSGIIKFNYDLIQFDGSNLLNFKIIHTNNLALALRLLQDDSKTYQYHPSFVILSTIILLSSITRLLPVLIIIWPYDNSTLELIMSLIQITNNYFVFTLIRSCFGGSSFKLILVLLITNLLVYFTTERGLLELVTRIFS